MAYSLVRTQLVLLFILEYVSTVHIIWEEAFTSQT